MKLFESFTPISKEQWYTKIEKELRERAISDLEVELSPGISISPFQHFDPDQPPVILPPPTFSPPKLGFKCTPEDEQKTNKIILEQLRGGVSYIHLNSGNELIDYATILEEVILKYIHLRTEVNSQSALNYFRSVIQNATVDLSDNLLLSGNIDGLKHKQKCLVYRLKEEHSRVQQLSDFALKAHAQLLQNAVGTVILQLDFGLNYAVEIAFARAFRLLWANLISVHQDADLAPKLIIEASVDPKVLTEDIHQNMIRISYGAMSMMSAGADVLYIPPADSLEAPNGNEFTRRISRNIFHLMCMESHMDKVNDPLSGSYYFDRATILLASAAWTELTTS